MQEISILYCVSQGRFLGFRHPGGEIHIESSGSWASCPGEEEPQSFFAEC